MRLEGASCYLRALEPEDLDLLFQIENNTSLWEVSHTLAPYSKYVLKQYLENSHKDIYEVKQLRLVICSKETNTPMGLVDLYDFDPKHQRAGIGIVIFDEALRGKGYAKEAISVVQEYAFEHLDLHQLYAVITGDNEASKRLFSALGYEKTGVKKDWIRSGGGFKDELIYQMIHA